RRSLWDLAPCAPTAGTRQLVERTIAAEQRNGLRVPPLTVRFVTAPPGYPAGSTTRDARGRIEIRRDAPPPAAGPVAAARHELVHAADFAAGRPFDRWFWEQRAERYCAERLVDDVW